MSVHIMMVQTEEGFAIWLLPTGTDLARNANHHQLAKANEQEPYFMSLIFSVVDWVPPIISYFPVHMDTRMRSNAQTLGDLLALVHSPPLEFQVLWFCLGSQCFFHYVL